MREFREELLDKHQDHKIRNLIVRDIMSSPLVSGDAGADTVVIVQLLLLTRSISAVPGVENGRIAGVVTRWSWSMPSDLPVPEVRTWVLSIPPPQFLADEDNGER